MTNTKKVTAKISWLNLSHLSQTVLYEGRLRHVLMFTIKRRPMPDSRGHLGMVISLPDHCEPSSYIIADSEVYLQEWAERVMSRWLSKAGLVPALGDCDETKETYEELEEKIAALENCYGPVW